MQFINPDRVKLNNQSADVTHRHKWQIGWINSFVGADPGLTRLRAAVQAVLSIGLAMIFEFAFVKISGALETPLRQGIPAAQAIKIAAANHAYMVIAILLGSAIGMISSFVVNDKTASNQLITTLILPCVMIPSLALGILLGSHRTLALILLAVILAIGTYIRRFGPRGFAGGMVMFMGYFFGFFLNGVVHLGDIGWLSAEIATGVVATSAIRFLLFYPDPQKALHRTKHSYYVRARNIAQLANEVLNGGITSARTIKQLNRQQILLNETALMIDAQLGEIDTTNTSSDAATAQQMHQYIFDIDLALTNIARFACVLANMNISQTLREEIAAALRYITQNDFQKVKGCAGSIHQILENELPEGIDANRLNAIIPYRMADSLTILAEARSGLDEPKNIELQSATFKPAVSLIGGWLPGSTQVSASASKESGRGASEKITLQPYTRTAIQVGLAVGASIALGVVLSPTRFYWAVIAAFITFIGANNAGEQIKKAILRVVGTLIGIWIGSMVASVIGNDARWSIPIILLSLFFGFYLMRISYAFMVIAITVMVAQLYGQLGELSNSLLLLRLEETAIGAAVTIVVIILVLPLKTRRVLRVALREHINAIISLCDEASTYLTGQQPKEANNTLRNKAREVDATYQSVISTSQPLRRNILGTVDKDIATTLRLASITRNYGRNLVRDCDESGPLPEDLREDIKKASKTLHDSLDILAESLTGTRDRTYTRSSSLFELSEQHLMGHSEGSIESAQLAIRDLKLIDGAMASLAQNIGLNVSGLDTEFANA